VVIATEIFALVRYRIRRSRRQPRQVPLLAREETLQEVDPVPLVRLRAGETSATAPAVEWSGEAENGSPPLYTRR